MGWHMSRPAEAAIDAWYEAVNGRGEAPADTTQTEVRGDLLYSYGPHFELARPLRDKKGQILAYLLNGDTYSNITSQHQQHVRHVLQREQTVIIPHEALNSAGIDLNTVRIVHVKEDTWTDTDHCTTEMPPRASWYTRPIQQRVRKSDAELGAMLTSKHREAIRDWASHRRYYRNAVEKGDESSIRIWSRYADKPMPTRPTIRGLTDWEQHKNVTVGYDRRLYTAPNGHGTEIKVTEQEDGTTLYEWTTTRHWLGESLIRARVTWTTTHRCPDCNGSGTGIGPSRSRWAVIMACPTCHGERGTTKTHHRWAYYLSGFDHEESQPLYFFAELPRGPKPTTVAEAYEALKPDPVKLAEQMGRPIFRQGDIFGVPTRMDAKALKAQGARIERRVTLNSPKPGVNLPYVLGTNHTATEVAYLPNGVTLARGTMYHDPSGRNPDHARRRIGDGKSWHVVVKNTVPVSVRR